MLFSWFKVRFDIADMRTKYIRAFLILCFSVAASGCSQPEGKEFLYIDVEFAALPQSSTFVYDYQLRIILGDEGETHPLVVELGSDNTGTDIIDLFPISELPLQAYTLQDSNAAVSTSINSGCVTCVNAAPIRDFSDKTKQFKKVSVSQINNTLRFKLQSTDTKAKSIKSILQVEVEATSTLQGADSQIDRFPDLTRDTNGDQMLTRADLIIEKPESGSGQLVRDNHNDTWADESSIDILSVTLKVK